jgi:hypothetical protein
VEKIPEYLATLFWAVSFLIFFGPIVTIMSIIGKIKLGLINIDLSSHSKFARFTLGIFGFAIWLAIYIPLLLLVINQSNIPINPSETLSAVTPQSNPAIIETPTLELQSSPTIPILPPTMEVIPTEIIFGEPKFMIITEVLGNPCGRDSRNEFVELYNSSDKPIDVGGWWVTDGDEADKIVEWEVRFPAMKIGFNTITNSTIIPPRSYAVILAPGYPFVSGNFAMPYIFPEGTVLLTLETGLLIGDEMSGIEVTNRDVIVLYQGTATLVEKVISTYGSPILSSSPTSIRDDNKDKIPVDTNTDDCWSVERIHATQDDIESNWRKIQKNTAGSGHYP